MYKHWKNARVRLEDHIIVQKNIIFRKIFIIFLICIIYYLLFININYVVSVMFEISLCIFTNVGLRLTICSSVKNKTILLRLACNFWKWITTVMMLQFVEVKICPITFCTAAVQEVIHTPALYGNEHLITALPRLGKSHPFSCCFFVFFVWHGCQSNLCILNIDKACLPNILMNNLYQYVCLQKHSEDTCI